MEPGCAAPVQGQHHRLARLCGQQDRPLVRHLSVQPEAAQLGRAGCSWPIYAAADRATGVGQARYNASDGISTFNALEATVEQRNFHGLDFHFSYTWSKCLANTLGYFGSYGDEEGAGESQTQATQNFFQNEYNPKGDYGRCTTDTASELWRLRVYNLPFGSGKAVRRQRQQGCEPGHRRLAGWRRHVTSTPASASLPLPAPIRGRLQPALCILAHRFLSAPPELRRGRLGLASLCRRCRSAAASARRISIRQRLREQPTASLVTAPAARCAVPA